MTGERGFDLFHLHLVAQLLFQGGDSPVGEPAGIDVSEIIQLRVDIQGKPVHGHETGTAYADRTYFAQRTSGCRLRSLLRDCVSEPYARSSRDSSSVHAEIGDRVDHALFERVHILFQPQIQPLQVQNRVTDQLAGTVIGDVAAPVDPEQFGPYAGEECLVHEQVLRVPAFTQRIDVGMFAQVGS